MKALAASAPVILVAASYAAYQALGGGSTQVGCPWQLHPGTGHDGTDQCGALDACRPNRADNCTRLPST